MRETSRRAAVGEAVGEAVGKAPGLHKKPQFARRVAQNPTGKFLAAGVGCQHVAEECLGVERTLSRVGQVERVLRRVLGA